MGKNLKIGFALHSIRTEQFATIEDSFDREGEINLSTGLNFAFEKDLKMIAVFTKFEFESNAKPFLIVETSCHFNINPDAWQMFGNEDTGNVVIPKNFMQHLTMIAIGTARGVLHAKTENTEFNSLILPTINATELVQEDVEANLST